MTLCRPIDTIDTSNEFKFVRQPNWPHTHSFLCSLSHFRRWATARHHHHHHHHHRKKRHKRKILVHDLDEQSVKVSVPNVINTESKEVKALATILHTRIASRYCFAGNRSGRFITTCPLDNHSDRLSAARNVFTIGRRDAANGTVNR